MEAKMTTLPRFPSMLSINISNNLRDIIFHYSYREYNGYD